MILSQIRVTYTMRTNLRAYECSSTACVTVVLQVPYLKSRLFDPGLIPIPP